METARGIIWIHSAPAALRPHIEWALGAALGSPVRLEWHEQPAELRAWRTEFAWRGRAGTGAALASALRGCERVRFEVTEDASSAGEGTRWAFTPALGVFSATIGRHGDILVPEERLRQAVIADALGRRPLAEAVQALMGEPWDAELEPFRHAADGAGVRWLHQVS